MAEWKLPKLQTWVRFPSPAPFKNRIARFFLFKLLAITVLAGVPAPARGEGGAVARLAPQPQPEDFVTVRRNELHLGEQPLRFWGATLPARLLSPDPDAPPERVEAEAMRYLATLKFLGINLIRIDVGPTETDGPKADLWIERARRAGVRLWVGDLSRTVSPVTPADAGVLDDPASAAAWRRAVEAAQASGQGVLLANSVATVWEPRLEILLLRRLRGAMRRFNDLTGLRWADDPTLAVWELAGSERWLERVYSGEWLELPAYFRWLLSDRWNTWLYRRYASDELLQTAWGSLLPYESLADQSVLLLPLGTPFATGPARPPVTARQADTRQFLEELWTHHKRRLEAQARLWGASPRQAPLLRELACAGRDSLSGAVVPTALRLSVSELVRHLAQIGDMPTDQPATPVQSLPGPAPQLLLIAPETAAGRQRVDGPWRVLTLGTPWSAVCWEHVSERTDGPPHDSAWRASLAAAGLAFRRQLAIPVPEPGAVRGDLLLQSEALVAFVQSRLLLGTEVRFARHDLTFTVRGAAAEPTATAETAAAPPAVPGAFTVSGALLAPEGGALAQSDRLTLFFGLDSEAPGPHALRLEVHAGFLLGRSFTVRDALSDDPVKQGTVTELPLEIALPRGVLRVEFSPAAQDRLSTRTR